MSTIPDFSAPVIGQTEKALNAILDRQLAGTGLTEPQWVTLAVTASGGEPIELDNLRGRVANALKVTDAEAQSHITALVAAHLLQACEGEGPSVKVTDVGHQLQHRIRAAVTEITARLWGDLPADDLATAARVLSTVLVRANAELANG